MPTQLDKVNPTNQSWPSEQVENIIADTQGYVWKLDNTAGNFKRICIDLTAPVIDRAAFGTAEMPLPPTGVKYLFADDSLAGTPLVTVDSAGVFATVQANLTFVSQSGNQVNFDRSALFRFYEGVAGIAFGTTAAAKGK